MSYNCCSMGQVTHTSPTPYQYQELNARGVSRSPETNGTSVDTLVVLGSKVSKIIVLVGSVVGTYKLLGPECSLIITAGAIALVSYQYIGSKNQQTQEPVYQAPIPSQLLSQEPVHSCHFEEPLVIPQAREQDFLTQHVFSAITGACLAIPTSIVLAIGAAAIDSPFDITCSTLQMPIALTIAGGMVAGMVISYVGDGVLRGSSGKVVKIGLCALGVVASPVAFVIRNMALEVLRECR